MVKPDATVTAGKRLIQLYFRPGLIDFMHSVAADDFEIVFWTAGIEEYADIAVQTILDQVMSDNLMKSRDFIQTP